MREDRGPAQALINGSAPADHSSRHLLQIPDCCIPRLEFPVTHSKQRIGSLSNRREMPIRLCESVRPFSSPGGIFLTPVPGLLYVSRVLEETVGLCPASNFRYRRGASFVGAGIGRGFEDSSYIFVQMLLEKLTAGVSLPGNFAFADRSARTARPHTSEEA